MDANKLPKVRAVVDERFRWWSDRQAEHLAVRGQDYAVAIMRDFWAWHESENSRAPREPAGEAEKRDGQQESPAGMQPDKSPSRVGVVGNALDDSRGRSPAAPATPAPPAPPAGGDELRTRLHAAWRDHEDDDARDALREIGRLDAALAAERAEVGRPNLIWGMRWAITELASGPGAEVERDKPAADKLRAELERMLKDTP
jgi:hypothetical protein